MVRSVWHLNSFDLTGSESPALLCLELRGCECVGKAEDYQDIELVFLEHCLDIVCKVR